MIELRNIVYNAPQGKSRPTSLVASAVLVDGKVWTGKRHHTLIQQVAEDTDGYVRQDQQGFWTDDNRFVMRLAAKTVAIRNGQIKESDMKSKTLTSEDLW